MIKITINNPISSNRNTLPQAFEPKLTSFTHSFLVHFKEFSSSLYAFVAKDYAHELFCEMTLEVKEIFVNWGEAGREGGYLTPVVVCSFPAINLEKLNEKIGFDSYLQGILVCRFYLKILEHLLLFCEEKSVSKLVLTVNNSELVYLEIFSFFFASLEEQINIEKDEQRQIAVPVNIHTYDIITDFMDEIDRDLRKILWREENIHPAFRADLKPNVYL